MKYGKYVLFIYDKKGQMVAFFTDDSEETIYDMVFKSSFREVDKYTYEMNGPEVIKSK